jgi:hypothetical protein
MKKIIRTLLLMFLLPSLGLAQNCIKPFSTNCWFNQVFAVRSTSDGTKFMAVGGLGPDANSNAASCAPVLTAIKVYDVSTSGIAYNPAQSTGISGVFTFSDFTGNNGYFYTVNTSGNSYSVNFKEASGTDHNLGTFNQPYYFQEIAGAPDKMIMRLGSTDQALILDATNPAAPTAIPLTLPGGDMTSTVDYRPLVIADQNEDRIYYVTTENETADVTSPYYRCKIKSCTFAGAAVPGWTDVVIQRGSPSEMGIRPTDRRLFIRISQIPNRHLNFHGLVVVDKNGTVPTDMNMSDLSLMSSPVALSSNSYHDLAFDSDGNIYANLWSATANSNVIAYGMMKFDPKGNLDIGFLRNVWNSYGQAAGGGANSFDITDGGVIIKCTNSSQTAYDDHYALSMDHVNANNEEPTTSTYSSLPNAVADWGTYPLFSNGPASNYQNVQFLFNNGKLVRPDANQTVIDQNCGLSTPIVAPPAPAPAGGLINCVKTAFISAPKPGNATSVAIRVEIDVTTAGTFSPITLSGSGFRLLDPNYTITATSTGVQTFVMPAYYDGSTLTTVDIGAGQAGTCTADLSTLPQDTKRVEIEIWTPENCTFKQVGPALK